MLIDTAFVAYKCRGFYARGSEGGIAWSDPGLGIDWPVAEPLFSDKDSKYPIYI